MSSTKEEMQCDTDYDRPVRLVESLYFQLTNPLKSDQGILSKNLISDNETTNQIIYKICKPQCISRVRRSDICTNKEHVIVFNPLLTFWIYLILRLVYQIFLNGSGNLFEGACLVIVTQVKGDLGLQRIFGLVGLMIFSPISGVLMDHFSIGRSIPDYRPAFYLYAGLVAILAVGILGIDLNFKAPNSNLLRDVKILLKEREQLAQQRQTLTQEMNTLQAQVKLRDNELNKRQDKIAAQDRILSERQARLQILEKRFQTLESQRQTLQGEINTRDSRISELDQVHNFRSKESIW
jgi:hypothetical protein